MNFQQMYFSNGLKPFEHRWVMCSELKKDNVEKKIEIIANFLLFVCRLNIYRTALVCATTMGNQSVSLLSQSLA